MRTKLNNWMSEPRADNPPRRVWRDWVVLAAVFVGLIVELVLRDDVRAPYAAVPFAVVLTVSLLWRRVEPFAVFVLAFGGMIVYDVVFELLGYGAMNLYSAAVLVIAEYSLFRWGSGREMVLGTPLAVILTILANTLDYTGVSDVIGGIVVLCLILAVALALRYRGGFMEQGREQVRILERERLARELHDTVAHHMSAIAIQAQAGQFVASQGSLEGASEALGVIEEEASRTLSEMRSIVGSLRDADAPVEMAPQHGMADIESLASSIGLPMVTVDVADNVRNANEGVGAAAYRIAQESITNARRHARNATKVRVQVSGGNGAVHLIIADDGEAATAANGPGFGLIGMNERATLLGGSLEAGPADTGGWVVRATLPRENGA